MNDRRRCTCHDEPMVLKGAGELTCAIKRRASNAQHTARSNRRRIFACGRYLGTENRFPAPREAVAQFARELIEQHRKESL